MESDAKKMWCTRSRMFLGVVALAGLLTIPGSGLAIAAG